MGSCCSKDDKAVSMGPSVESLNNRRSLKIAYRMETEEDEEYKGGSLETE